MSEEEVELYKEHNPKEEYKETDFTKAFTSRKKKLVKFNVDVKSKVQFDYVFHSWTIPHKFHKSCRANFIDTFLNKVIHSNLFWINYKTKFRVLVNSLLLKDETYDRYVEFNSVSLNRQTLAKLLGDKAVEQLKNMGREYTKITSQNQHVKKKIEELEKDDYPIMNYNVFDVEKFEIDEEIGGNKWESFKNGEEENDERDV